MKRTKFLWILIRAIFELVRFEVIVWLCGPGSIKRQLRRQSGSVAGGLTSQELERDICEAVLLATCFYWKPVLCLQRSVCAVRLLRKHGIAARLVVGYRPVPFFSHAWVEVEARVVNCSPVYKQRLRLLYTA